jgi:hypothetical protein
VQRYTYLRTVFSFDCVPTYDSRFVEVWFGLCGSECTPQPSFRQLPHEATRDSAAIDKQGWFQARD